MQLLNQKMYVIGSPALLAAVERHPHAISMEPIAEEMVDRVAGFKGNSLNIFESKKKGGSGFNKKLVHHFYKNLLGDELNELSQNTVKALEMSADQLKSLQNKSIDLYAWCRHVMTMATTKAAYGPENPYNSPSIEQGIW